MLCAPSLATGESTTEIESSEVSPVSRSATLVILPLQPGQYLAKIRTAWDIESVLGKIEAQLVAEGLNRTFRLHVTLAMNEAIVNALKHGNGNDAYKQVRIWWTVNDAYVRAAVEDEGAGFDPRQVPNPRAVENLESPSGRGLLMMRELMTSVRFNSRGNCVELCKEIAELDRRSNAGT